MASHRFHVGTRPAIRTTTARLVACLILPVSYGCDRAANPSAHAPIAASQAALPTTVVAAFDLPSESIVVPPVETPADGKQPKFPRGSIALTAEPLDESVLPYQSTIVRVSLVNVTGEVMGPVSDLLYLHLGIARQDKYFRKGVPFSPIDLPQPFNNLRGFRLGPRQRITIEMPVGCMVSGGDTRHLPDKIIGQRTFEPLFFSRERPELFVHYDGVGGPIDDDDPQTSVPLTLKQPVGEDRECFEMLTADPRLARRLYDIDTLPEPAQILGLEAIVTRWPRSSYADYARFALARARLGGHGERLPRLTERLMLRASGQPYSSRVNEHARLAKRLSPFLQEETRRRLREGLTEGSPLPFRRRFAAGIETQSHLSASLADRQEALRLLDEIHNPNFPFAARALYLKHRVAEIDEPQRLPAIGAEFHRNHSCSIEWLLILSQNYSSPGPSEIQRWADYRIRTSSRDGSTDVRTNPDPGPGAEEPAGVAVAETWELRHSNWEKMSSIEQKPPDSMPLDQTRVRVEASTSDSKVLPFQTVRIRYRLVNMSTVTVGPFHQLHDPVAELTMDGSPPEVVGNYLAGAPKPGGSTCCDVEYRRDIPLFLRPGESTSISFPLVAVGIFELEPLFDRPKRVELTFTFRDIDADRIKLHSFAYEVVEPTGIDRIVYDELRRHPAAALALAGYEYEVSETAARLLEELLEKFPSSSYADYLRLALARGLWGGDAPGSCGRHGGDTPVIGRYDTEAPFFGRPSIRWGLHGHGSDPAMLRTRCFSLLTSDFQSAWFPELAAERAEAAGDPLRFYLLQNKLAQLSGTNLSRRKRIVSLLRAIDRRRFPLAPVVTYYLARTLAIDDPAAGAAEYTRLVSEYADAFEWLERLESSSISDDDWVEYRIDPPR